MQQYQGFANWTLLESFAELAPLPIIGNGDLHTAESAIERLKVTRCQALMLGRGQLRDPFIFLNAFREADDEISFDGADYWEIIQRLYDYQREYVWHEKTLSVQMRKFIVWMSAGFPGASHFRRDLFSYKTTDEVMKQTESFFATSKRMTNQLITPNRLWRAVTVKPTSCHATVKPTSATVKHATAKHSKFCIQVFFSSLK